MTIALIIFALLMSLVSLGHGIRKGAARFELITGMVFSVVFFILAVCIWQGVI
jgi:hypothetical protein